MEFEILRVLAFDGTFNLILEMHYIILVFKIENSMTITFTYLIYGRASTVTYYICKLVRAL